MRADVALFLEEPFGPFGGLTPTGHAAIYLTRVCAASLTQLRRCEPGEPGVVISRYRKIAGYDWIAIPLLPYLYSVDSVQDIPRFADAKSVAALRDAYRRTHLLAIAPGEDGGRPPGGEWTQLVGSAYDRRIYEYMVATSPRQDDAFIEQFNHRKNTSRYNVLFHNCADFALAVLNFYYPRAIHRNILADAGITTPKQVAKSLMGYCGRHPEVPCASLVIPQVSGSLPRSERVDGVLEALLKTKKYVLPLAVLHPLVTGGLAAAYLAEGRFNPRRKDAVVFDAHALRPPWADTANSELAHSNPPKLTRTAGDENVSDRGSSRLQH